MNGLDGKTVLVAGGTGGIGTATAQRLGAEGANVVVGSDVNRRGSLLCTRHAVPELLARGGGAVVYTSSNAAFVGEPERVDGGMLLR